MSCTLLCRASFGIVKRARTRPTSSRRRRLSSGTLLTRPYKGTTVQVRVLEHGLLYEGTIYPSLSSVAKAVTGSHCSGYRFFRLLPKGVAS
jgi:hypothetical protein